VTRDLRPLFDPRSVAVVGVSADPAKWGYWMARGAARGTHRRDVFLVGRSGGELHGLPVHRSLAEVPAPPELVVLTVPARGLEEVVDEALAAGARALVAIAAGLVALAAFARHDEDSSVLAFIGLRQIDLRRAALTGAAVAATGAASLGVLDLFQREWTFPWGEVAVTGLWSAVAMAALLVGLRRDSALVTLSGFVAYLAPIAKALTSDASLGEPERWYALLVVGVAALAGGLAYQLLERRLKTLHAVGLTLHGTGLVLGATGVIALLGPDRIGTALLVLAAAYGLLAAAIFRLDRQRDHATLLWSIALGFAAVAAPEILDGTLLVLAWTAPAAALALLAQRLREPRFLIASAGLLTAALAETLAKLAPPTELTSASVHPGEGAAALALSLAAGLVLVWVGRKRIEAADDAPRSEEYRDVARALRELVETTRIPALWTSGLLALYTVSLGLLELFEQLTPGSIEDRFQHGHTAVSACWALVALGLLYAGLVRRSRPLRLGGFALFGAALGKLFLYDLATLSSITRALSFLAVGALLLIAGFFYQRITQQLGLRDDEPQLSAS
jgi:predicted CoA-binding protein